MKQSRKQLHCDHFAHSNSIGSEAMKEDMNETKKKMQQDLRRGLWHSSSENVMDMINSSLRPDPRQLYTACMEARQDLLAAFRENFPSACIHVFGSTAIGTAMKGN